MSETDSKKYIPKKGEFFTIKSMVNSLPLYFCTSSENSLVSYRPALFLDSTPINSDVNYCSFIEASSDFILSNIKSILTNEFINNVIFYQNEKTGTNHRIHNLLLINTLKFAQLKEMELLTKLMLLKDSLSFNNDELLEILYQFRITSVEKLHLLCLDIQDGLLSKYLGERVSSEDFYRLTYKLEKGFYLNELFESLLSIKLSHNTIRKIESSVDSETDYIKEIINCSDHFPKHVVDELNDKELNEFFNNTSGEHALNLNILRNVLKYFPIKKETSGSDIFTDVVENKSVYVREYLTIVIPKGSLKNNGIVSTLSVIKTMFNRGDEDVVDCIVKFKDLSEENLNSYYLTNTEFLHNYCFYHGGYEIYVGKELTNGWVQIEN